MTHRLMKTDSKITKKTMMKTNIKLVSRLKTPDPDSECDVLMIIDSDNRQG